MLNGKRYEGIYRLSEYQDNIKGNKNVSGYVTVNDKFEVELVMEAENTKDYCYVKSSDDDSVRYYKNENGVCTINEVTPVEDSCFEYSESNGEITITGYKCGGKITELGSVETLDSEYTTIVSFIPGEVMDVVIPSKINGKPVTKIGTGAFSVVKVVNIETADFIFELDKKVIISSIVIPPTVKEISDSAFTLNELENVTLSEGLKKIGSGAFGTNQKLSRIIIPNSVTSLGVGSFLFCNLSSVLLGSGLTKISDSAFALNKLNSISFPNSIVEVEDAAFLGNKITSIDFNKVQKIGYLSFGHNNISGELIIGNNVSIIESNSFSSNNIEKFIVSSSVTSIASGAFFRSDDSNPALKTIVNKTGKAFDWWDIVYFGEHPTFVTGIIDWQDRIINVVSE